MKSLPAIFLLLLVTFLTSMPLAAKQFLYDSQCKLAYQSIFKLRFQEGRAHLLKARQQNPENLMPDFIENYIDFLATYISEEQQLFDKLSAKEGY